MYNDNNDVDDDDDVVVVMVTACDCSLAGSVTVTNSTLAACDHVTGQCYCLKPGITGRRCDMCLPASNSQSRFYRCSFRLFYDRHRPTDAF